MEKKKGNAEKTRTDAKEKQEKKVSKQNSGRKVSKAWEAAQRLKGSVIINYPTLAAAAHFE